MQRRNKLADKLREGKIGRLKSELGGGGVTTRVQPPGHAEDCAPKQHGGVKPDAAGESPAHPCPSSEPVQDAVEALRERLERIRDIDEQTSDGALGSLARYALDELAALAADPVKELAKEPGEELPSYDEFCAVAENNSVEGQHEFDPTAYERVGRLRADPVTAFYCSTASIERPESFAGGRFDLIEDVAVNPQWELLAEIDGEES